MTPTTVKANGFIKRVKEYWPIILFALAVVTVAIETRVQVRANAQTIADAKVTEAQEVQQTQQMAQDVTALKTDMANIKEDVSETRTDIKALLSAVGKILGKVGVE